MRTLYYFDGTLEILYEVQKLQVNVMQQYKMNIPSCTLFHVTRLVCYPINWIKWQAGMRKKGVE